MVKNFPNLIGTEKQKLMFLVLCNNFLAVKQKEFGDPEPLVNQYQLYRTLAAYSYSCFIFFSRCLVVMQLN